MAPMLSNSEHSYGTIAKLLHWSVAALILTLIPLGIYMHELPADSADAAAHKFWFYSLHKTLGVALLAIALMRVAWAAVQPHPRPLHPERKLETLAAQTVHYILYGCILLMPLTGWLHHSALDGFAPIWWPLFQDLPLVPKSPALAEVFAAAHFFTGTLLVLAIFLHIAGALKHAFVDRDNTLRRMLPGPALPDMAHSSPPPVRKRTPALLAGLAVLVVIVASAATHLPSQPGPQQAAPPAAPAASRANWQVDHAKSTLSIEVLQSGKPLTGSFGRWTATIRFNPDDLAASEVSVDVETSSLSLGGVSQQAISPTFLNAAAFPGARFASKDFRSTGNDTYEARSELTLLGKTMQLNLPFTLRIENGRAFMQGETTIKRLDYGIGANGFQTGNMVGLEVKVKVSIEAQGS